MNPEWLSTAAVIGAVVLLIAALSFVWWWVPKKQADRLRLKIRDPKARADIEDNFRKTLSQLFGGVAVLLGAAFAYYQSQLAAEQARLSLKASFDLLTSQQTSKGFEQLGSDNIIVRLGGLYALEGVMNTSPAYHQPVMEALAAFIRQNAPIETTPSPDPATSNTPINPPPTDVQAALTVLGRRVIQPDEGPIDLNGAKLVRANLSSANLSSAILVRANLSSANLFGTNLVRAILVRANLNSAILFGANLSNADLSDADLKETNLVRAYLPGANLSGAKLVSAKLVSANLSGASLIGADLLGADLSGANLSDANLFGANLQRADLFGANLSGADLKETNLNNIRCSPATEFPPGFAVSCRD
jgi:uncharacterized protein YjbI with pentapeptide repeats